MAQDRTRSDGTENAKILHRIIEVICAGMNDAAGTADNSQSVAYKLTSDKGVLHIHLPKPAEVAKKQQKIEIKKA
jgi:hypothetical protein